MSTYKLLLKLRKEHSPAFDMTNFGLDELKYYLTFNHEQNVYEIHSSLHCEILGVVYMPYACAEFVKETLEDQRLTAITQEH